MKNKLQIIGKKIKSFWKDESGFTAVEMILILVGILTPYYGVGIRCIE